MSSSKDFFKSLQPLNDYSLMIEGQYYKDLPQDWCVVLTDVKNSTQAIEAGRYKEVNMVGVSCIIAVQNALEDLEIPFVFGGDGATLAVPMSEAAKIKEALSHTRAVALKHFALGLRIAVIPVSEILKSGAALKVAKLTISDGHHLALIRGDGWTLAEKWMKERESDFDLPTDYPTGGDHDGLECRWNPLPARQSEVMAIIVQSRRSGESGLQTYRDILREILNPELRPISPSELKLAWPPKYLMQEARMRAPKFFARIKYIFKGYSISLLHFLVLKLRGEKKNISDPIPYLNELTQNTDYLKFDECLRVVIDVSTGQKKSLLQRLEKHYQDGDIFYGTHSDACALMTCYIQGPKKHLHFVDAGGGGYAMAAKQLKAQKRLV